MEDLDRLLRVPTAVLRRERVIDVVVVIVDVVVVVVVVVVVDVDVVLVVVVSWTDEIFNSVTSFVGQLVRAHLKARG